MARSTALEVLLSQAGYSLRRARRLASIIDAAGIPGMSADDLYSAFIRWKESNGLTDSAVRTMSAEHFTQTNLYERLRSTIDGMVEDIKTGQLYFGYKVGEKPPESPATPPAAPSRSG